MLESQLSVRSPQQTLNLLLNDYSQDLHTFLMMEINSVHAHVYAYTLLGTTTFEVQVKAGVQVFTDMHQKHCEFSTIKGKYS